MARMTPIESEFPTTEDAVAHDVWFRTKVAAALASKESPIPHDEVMAEIKGILEAKRGAAARLAG